MINYVAKFIPNSSQITQPLRVLLEKGVEFFIDTPQLQAIEQLKKLVTSTPVLQFFNPNNPIRLRTDASSYGLGAMIEQEFNGEWKPIGYSSRSLTSCEKQYAQIEKEMLSIMYGCEKFHEYLYGYEFEILNDHKPLSYILTKLLYQCPHRIQRFYLKLMKYHFKFEHQSGKMMTISDALSRAVDTYSKPELSNNDVEAYVHHIVDHLPISENRLKQLQMETRKDATLNLLSQYTLNGWPEKDKIEFSVKPYYAFRGEI